MSLLHSILLSYQNVQTKKNAQTTTFVHQAVDSCIHQHLLLSSTGKPMLLGRLIVDDVAQMNRGRIKDLLVQDLKWTTLLLWFIW